MYVRLSEPHRLDELPKPQKTVSELRRDFPIAIIDNDPFEHAEILRAHGYDVKELGDIKDMAAVEAYRIVSCDIKDVGTHFRSPFEGAHLLSELRKRYPAKHLIAYSSGAYGPEFKRLLDAADVFLRRSAPVDDWIETLDSAIISLSDPATYWRKVRDLLLSYDAPAFDVYLLEDAYIRSILKRNEFVLTKELRRVRKRHAAGKIAGDVIEIIGGTLIPSIKFYIHLMA